MKSTPGKGKGKARTLLEVALDLSERYHWNLIPVDRDKRPTEKWKRWQGRKPDREDLEQMFAPAHVTGIAVLSGKVSDGLVIRDFDEEEAYLCWRKKQPRLVDILPTVVTRRGYHVYFRGPSLFEKMEDGEYRGTEKQYTLIPPSLHPSGAHYQWLMEPGDFIPCVPNPWESGFLPPLVNQNPPQL